MSEIVAEAVRHGLASHYAQGFKDGVGETLDQLENASQRAGAGGYRGPMPDELRAWIAAVRARMEP